MSRLNEAIKELYIIVVLVKGWRKSSGTKDEIVFAKYTNKNICVWDYKNKTMGKWWTT